MKRRKMSNRKSKAVFKKNTGIQKLNVIRPMRGGTRL